MRFLLFVHYVILLMDFSVVSEFNLITWTASLLEMYGMFLLATYY